MRRGRGEEGTSRESKEEEEQARGRWRGREESEQRRSTTMRARGGDEEGSSQLRPSRHSDKLRRLRHPQRRLTSAVKRFEHAANRSIARVKVAAADEHVRPFVRAAV